MIKRFLLIILSVISLSSFYGSREIIFALGDATCMLFQYRKPHAVATIIALHDNEQTCINAYKALPPGYPFNLFEIHQNGQRLLKYKERGKLYYFDPNRIFTTVGIKKTTKKYNTVFPRSLQKNIKRFSDGLLANLISARHNGYVVAIHNNTQGNFSVYTYKNSKNAAQVFISAAEDPDDFFIVTQYADFIYFKNLNMNVVLQSNHAEDDGSLSVYCQQKKIPYINVEAQHGHRTKQTEMLKLCYRLLSKK